MKSDREIRRLGRWRGALLTAVSALGLLLTPELRAQTDAAPDPQPKAEQAESAPALAAEKVSPDEAKPSLLVMQTSVSGQTEGQVDATGLTNLVSSLVTEQAQHEVMSYEDVRAMLSNEEQKQLVGCDDVSCFAEIGNALGARYLLYSNVGETGGSAVVTVSLIDAAAARNVDRQSLVVDDRRQIVDAVRVVTLRLLGQEAELEPLPAEGPGLGLFAWTALGLGAAAAVTGGAGTGLALMFREQALAATEQDAFDGARSSGETSNIVAVSGYAAGGVLLLAGGALLLADVLMQPADEETGGAEVADEE